MANIAVCYRCRQVIHHVGKRWVHKGGVPYNHVGGDHMASPFDPSVGDTRVSPSKDGVPSDRDRSTDPGGTPPT
jgi:hypothetical protein